MNCIVIKADEVPRMGSGLCNLALGDIAAKAERMVSTAQAEAGAIVARAREQAESQAAAIREVADRAGHDEGYEAGLAAGQAAGLAEARDRLKQEHSQLLITLNQLIGEFDRQRDNLYVSARRDVVLLAVAIAQRICSRFAAAEDIAPIVAQEACAEALGKLRGPTDVVIRAHPRDAESIQHLAEETAAAIESSRNIRIVEDEEIGRGGVVVESAETSLDATIESRIEKIADELVTDWRQRMKDLQIKQ